MSDALPTHAARPPRSSNNLDALRLAGAVAVIVGHAYVLLGAPEGVPGVLGSSISTFGVIVFFSISGYLISESWLRRRDPLDFAIARSARILPALGVTVVLTAFVLGPVLTSLPLGTYLASPATWDYLWNAALRPVYALPGVLEGNPYPSAVNGSLWTLPVEFACYLATPLILVARARWLQIAMAAAALVGSIALQHAFGPGGTPIVVYGTDLGSAASMWVFFVAGMLIRLAVPTSALRAEVALLGVLGHLLVLQVEPAIAPYTAIVVVPYAVLAVGLASTPVLRRAARFGDLSYGMYLWAFPVQQTLVAAAGVVPVAASIVVVTAVSAALAFVSWHVVERRALRLRRTLGSRRRHRALVAVDA